MVGYLALTKSDRGGGRGIIYASDRRFAMTRTFTAVIHKEDSWYVADCPEVGTVSQGKTVEEAVANLKEATELYFEEFSHPGALRRDE